MALISCPGCGGQVSDRAETCPRCGAPVAVRQSAVPVQPVYNTPYRQSGGKNKVAVGIGIAAGVLVIVLIAVSLIVGSAGSSPGEDVSAGGFPNVSAGVGGTQNNSVGTQVNTYNVTLNVECEYNDFINHYDVDILIDGEPIATLAHGAADNYTLSLGEGTHRVEFRVNGKHKAITGGGDIYDPDKPETFSIKNILVSKDAEYSYRAKLVWGDGIEVEQLV